MKPLTSSKSRKLLRNEVHSWNPCPYNPSTSQYNTAQLCHPGNKPYSNHRVNKSKTRKYGASEEKRCDLWWNLKRGAAKKSTLFHLAVSGVTVICLTLRSHWFIVELGVLWSALYECHPLCSTLANCNRCIYNEGDSKDRGRQDRKSQAYCNHWAHF